MFKTRIENIVNVCNEVWDRLCRLKDSANHWSITGHEVHFTKIFCALLCKNVRGLTNMNSQYKKRGQNSEERTCGCVCVLCVCVI